MEKTPVPIIAVPKLDVTKSQPKRGPQRFVYILSAKSGNPIKTVSGVRLQVE
jgi:hypothetical protein